MLPNVEAWNHSKWIFQYLTLPVSCFLVNQVCHCGVDFMTFLPLLNFDLGLERQHSENLRGASFMRHSYRLTVLKTWKRIPH
jgi:hypothetical protein